MTVPQMKTILKLDTNPQSAYDLSITLSVLNKLLEQKLVTTISEPGHLFFPKIGIKWKLSTEGLKLKSKLINEFDIFFQNYIICALWSSTYGEDNKNIDDDYDIDNFDQTSLEKLKTEAQDFFLNNYELMNKGNINRDYHENIAQAGYDFWLTRNHHGAGFWETSDWKESQGKKLTANSQKYKEINLYVENDKIFTD